MKLSPPLTTLALIAAAFGFMAWQYEEPAQYTKTVYWLPAGNIKHMPIIVYHSKGWRCEMTDAGPTVFRNGEKILHCPGWDGIDQAHSDGIPHDRAGVRGCTKVANYIYNCPPGTPKFRTYYQGIPVD